MTIDTIYGEIGETDKHYSEIRKNDKEAWKALIENSGVILEGADKCNARYNLLESAIIATHPGESFRMARVEYMPGVYEVIYLGENINAKDVVERMLLEHPGLRKTESDADDLIRTVKIRGSGGGGF